MPWAAGNSGVIAWMNAIDTERGAWSTYTPTLTNVTGTFSLARYKQIGKLVVVNAVFTLSAAPTGIINVSQPVTELAASHTAQTILGSALATQGGTAVVGLVQQANAGGFLFIGAGGNWTTSVPFAWASGNIVGFTAQYEAA